jgi:hypothetical protein
MGQDGMPWQDGRLNQNALIIKVKYPNEGDHITYTRYMIKQEGDSNIATLKSYKDIFWVKVSLIYHL